MTTGAAQLVGVDSIQQFVGLQPVLAGKPVIEQDVPIGSKSLTTMRCCKLSLIYIFF